MGQMYKNTKILTSSGNEHFVMASTVAISADEFTPVARLTVGAQRREFVGNGAIKDGVDDRGDFVFAPQTSSPAAISGEVRIFVNNANGTKPTFIKTVRSEDLLSSSTSVLKKLGLTNIGVGEDSYIEIQMKADSAATATLADSTLRFPTTTEYL